MKIRQNYIISHLQITISLLLCAMLLLLVGLCAVLAQGDIRQNALETARWQSKALSYEIEISLMVRFDLPFPEKDSPDFEDVSLQIQQWLEQYQDAEVEQIGILDSNGHWFAHQDASLRHTPAPQAFLMALEERKGRVMPGAGLYHSLSPFFDQHNNDMVMLYIGLSKAPLHQKIWQSLVKYLVLFVLLVLSVVGGFLLLTHETFLTIRVLLHRSTAISSGDLSSVEIPVRGIGDVRRLTQAFHDISQILHSISFQVRNAVSLIKAVSQNILEATDRLAASLEEQSASIAQTSINMENVALASQQISKSTDHVVQIAEKTREDAQQGLQIAKETLDKMGDIQHSHQTDARNLQELKHKSQEISKIMDVIVTIADQTKLIAFNASLEAAGAGKAGRRFSIVAQEIRSLADNVIGSTTNIRKSIAAMQNSVQNLQHSFESSTERIQQGAEYTTSTTEWLRAILSGTTQSTRIAQKISRSLLKQQLASEEISSALKEQLSNTNESAKAGAMTRDIAEQLERLTRELEDAISGIKV
ncbi:MAG: hypothetical protein GY801_22590 [bacterium]|nr:hypothetical protein [bacterium]